MHTPDNDIIEIEKYIIKIYKSIDYIFLSKNEYASVDIRYINLYIDIFSKAGLSTESSMSREDYIDNINTISEKIGEYPTKLTIYYHDIQKIISGIQEILNDIFTSYKDIMDQMSDLSTTHTDPLIINKTPDCITYDYGIGVSYIWRCINTFFISIISSLDYINKLCCEINEIKSGKSNSNNRLKSKDILYNPKKPDRFLEKESSTIFENSDNIIYCYNIRNMIIHNSGIDTLRKLYLRYEAGILVEKFILLPDREEGIITSYKTRKHFYSQELKSDNVIDNIYKDYILRIKNSIIYIDKWINN